MMLAGEMLLRHIGWQEAGELITKGVHATLAAGIMTYDLKRMMPVGAPATEVKCSAFGEAVTERM
eukprot:NODE_5963_length_477_cov_437.936916_g4489_i0.p1 GENE.NODE_5963_length_477_cov_437.936916_g4489_i0~~NODE_5963_length_477_cov_437.936916_g4489_i0.p1  ORF type:complete len:65 (-),score=27.76 NODE_5963_length_477_cov_437.936916_g4489_i0:200-394(-)